MFPEEIVLDLRFYQSWARGGAVIVVCCLVATIVLRLIQRKISGVMQDKFKIFIYTLTIFGMLDVGIGGCVGVHTCKRILRVIGDSSLEEWDEILHITYGMDFESAIPLISVGAVVSFGMTILIIWDFVRFYKRLQRGQGAGGDYWVGKTSNAKRSVVEKEIEQAEDDGLNEKGE